MLSIVVPILNEAESLVELVSEIRTACDAAQLNFEIVFVDDGSTDATWSVIQSLVTAHPFCRAIRLRGNFGKAAALSAGMRAAKGELLFMMDADLQDDPAEIPRFLEQIAAGFDVVNGWKVRRLDPWHKVYPSWVFNGMVSWLTGVKLHDHNCGLKCFRKEVAEEIRLYGELHRFIPVLAAARGFRICELPIHHRERKFGSSKYGIRRFLRGFLDLLTVKFLTGFGQRPQHALGAWGLFFAGLGLLGLLYLSGVWLGTNLLRMDWGRIGDRPLLAYSIASLLLGGQMLSLGLLAELIVAYTGRSRDTYSIADRLPRELDPPPS